MQAQHTFIFTIVLARVLPHIIYIANLPTGFLSLNFITLMSASFTTHNNPLIIAHLLECDRIHFEIDRISHGFICHNNMNKLGKNECVVLSFCRSVSLPGHCLSFRHCRNCHNIVFVNSAINISTSWILRQIKSPSPSSQ
jgi:hypothetical protein